MSEIRECNNAYCSNEFEPAVHNQRYCCKTCKNAARNQKLKDYTTDLAEALAPRYFLDDEIEDEDRLEYLRRDNARLERALDKYKIAKNENSRILYETAKEVFSSFKQELPNTTQPKHNPTKKTLVPVIVWADFQLGKVSPTYNSEICRDRIVNIYMDEVLSYIDLYRNNYNIDQARIWLLGDIVEGEGVYPGQSWQTDSGLYRQVGVNGPEILRDATARLLEVIDDIRVTAIIGNHGYSYKTKDFDPETNMDRLLYKIMEYIFAHDNRVSFNIPDGRGESNFYAVDRIGNYASLLLHGDQFSQPSSNISYLKKVLAWKDGGIPEDFDEVFLGHWHHEVKMTLGSTILRVSPSPESYNTYAQERIGVIGKAAQVLLFVDPDEGTVFSEHSIVLE